MGIFSRSSSRKLSIKQRQQKRPLLPVHMQNFISRRVTDFMGTLLLTCAGALFAMLASYHPADPSLNTAATADVVHNIFGMAGAYTADLFLQTLGLAAYLFPVAFMTWGGRVLLRRPLAGMGVRIPFLMISVVAAAVALARVPSFDGFGIGTYMGGSAGALIFTTLGNYLQGWLGGLAFIFVAGAAFLMASGMYVWSLGVSFGEWRDGFSLLRESSQNAMDWAQDKWEDVRAWYDDFRAGEEETPATRGSAQIILQGDDVPEEDSAETEAGLLPRRRPVVTQRKDKQKTAKKDDRQKKLNLRSTDDEWQLPPMSLLMDPPTTSVGKLDEAGLQKNAELLQATLNDFGVQGEILKVSPGPIVTLYEMEPAPGTKTSRVIGLSDDIARSMSAISVRVAVVPGKNAIGMELPNAKRETVFLKEMLTAKDYDKTQAKLPLALGKNIAGDPVIADLARMPHLLVAGTTGSGKSVAVNTMILSLLYRLSPEQCRFIMIDPKMLELSVYDDIPHLLTPVVTEPHRALTALKWAVGEMEDRYRAMSKLGVRNIEGFNERITEARNKGEVLMHRIQTGFDADTGKPVFEEQPIPLNDLPYIVIVVDEFADLMLVAGKDVENAIQRLAQMARAAGIHLIMATQRPSVDVITGVIKANFPTRISFQVTSKIDSRTILGEGGAEQLLGQGDMLYMAAGGRITRVHGPFVSDDEVEKVVAALRAQGVPNYIDGVTEGGDDGDASGGGLGGGGDYDEYYDRAVALVLQERKVSTSFIQRHFQIGYNRAARIVERMEKEGVISTANHAGKREILPERYGT